ncbi:MAG TPA: glucoamylase family protein, partial [Lacipirellulaceae bacterium]|nr:glucoamylase family protein [Lacipirellulaceae bacterium]
KLVVGDRQASSSVQGAIMKLRCVTLAGVVGSSLFVGMIAWFVALTPVDALAEAFANAQDAEFLEDLQRRTFDFFWETANPRNGLIPDRWPSAGAPCSVAAVGFGLTAYGVGVEREYITRDQAIERVLTTLRFLWNAPQSFERENVTGYRGFFYHFLDMETGLRKRQCELSSIDTALLMAGVLFCGEYFDRDDPREQEIRQLADALYRRVEWSWMQPRPPLVCMSWRPEHDRAFGNHEYRGYDEAMILYLLAMGSPTHPIDPAAWDAFVSTYAWAEFHGQEHVNFSPLFGHQYSHVWVDFRGIQDEYMREKGIDYFETSRRAVLSQQAYAAENPQGWIGYHKNVWGLTACDGPANVTREVGGVPRKFQTYWARGASVRHINDDGTIAPTAAGGSIPFAPQIAIAALREMKARYGEHLYARYGFLDSFNPSFTFHDVRLGHGKVLPGVGWVNDDYLGIDQGPIVLMLENHRSGLVWNVMRTNANLRNGLQRAQFQGGWLQE